MVNCVPAHLSKWSWWSFTHVSSAVYHYADTADIFILFISVSGWHGNKLLVHVTFHVNKNTGIWSTKQSPNRGIVLLFYSDWITAICLHDTRYDSPHSSKNAWIPTQVDRSGCISKSRILFKTITSLFHVFCPLKPTAHSLRPLTLPVLNTCDLRKGESAVNSTAAINSQLIWTRSNIHSHLDSNPGQLHALWLIRASLALSLASRTGRWHSLSLSLFLY